MSDKGLAEDRPLPDDWVKLTDVELLYLARAPVDSEGFGASWLMSLSAGRRFRVLFSM